MRLRVREEELGRLAAAVVARNGGFMSFEDYDEAMLGEYYFAPLSWAAGWELPYLMKKGNDDKLCAFAAVEMGLLVQSECIGYRWSAME